MPMVFITIIHSKFNHSLPHIDSLMCLFKPFSVLGEYCKVHEAFEDEYETSYEIAKFGNEPTNDNTGYYFRLPLWVQGERDASILISVDKSTNTHDVYEISEFKVFYFCCCLLTTLLKLKNTIDFSYRWMGKHTNRHQ